jgi:hypothetical protein
MIDVKEAVRIAEAYFSDLYHDQPFTNVLPEETEYDADAHVWRITLGYSLPLPWDAFGSYRRYKIFEIDAKKGEVRSMKIRRIENGQPYEEDAAPPTTTPTLHWKL